MVDSQVTEEIEVPISSNIPSFNNNNEVSVEYNENMYHSAEAVIPYENFVMMNNRALEENTPYTPLSMELREETKGVHRNAEVRRMALLALKNGTKREAILRQFKIHRNTLWRWKKEWKKDKKIAPTKAIGRPRTLWEEPIQRILGALDSNPSATNEMLAALTHNMVCPQSISNYLKREEYSRKKIVDGGAQKMDDRIIGETRDYYLAVKSVPWENRVYMDESFVYNNEAPSMGRSKKGQPINRVRDKRGKRWTMYLAIRWDGLVHPPILKPENADDKEFMKYVEESLVPLLRPGEVVIWDRLGRSGRCKNPCKQHYNPLARQMIEDKGCRLMILPPKGKYFDPIELVFGLLKGEVRRTYGHSVAAMEQRPRNKEEIFEAVAEAAQKVTAHHIRKFYKERADGRSFRKVYEDLVERIFF